MLREQIECEILPFVEKPARYLGNEYFSIKKDWSKTSIKMAFCFPDLYEVAMSHLGLRILYGLVNEQAEYAMERCFAPWTDMENELRKREVPLFSLESGRPIKEFDVVGFTLQYEMSYTNILNMLDLSGIPLKADERTDEHPIIIAGGPCATNPEPLAEFMDLFIIGDGEERILQVLALAKEGKKEHRISRKQFLTRAAQLPGVYVPAYYEFFYDEKGCISQIKGKENVPLPIRRGIVKDLDQTYFPTKPIVPFVEAIHDRVMLEVSRGCTRGCRFCQAGIIYRPVRERSPEVIAKQAEESLKWTGYEEVSLTSLSSADYSCIEQVSRNLLKVLEPKKIGLSLPSLRVDSFSVDLAKEIQKVRKTGLTFAPEAGTQRLRNVINKGVTEEDLERAVSGAFEAGWDTIKLYFMIGLPTETDEDIEGIAKLAYQVLAIGREIKKRQNAKKNIKVTVSVSSFVPKPHTPFQWVAQDTIEVLQKKQKKLRELLKDRRISYQYHDPYISFLEAVFSKGDRRLHAVLKAAWEKGCKFDSWNEHFDYGLWMEAFKECNIDPAFYAYRAREQEEIFPWDVIDVGVTKRFLYSEYRNALAEKHTEDCRHAKCTGCGVCQRFDVGLVIQEEIKHEDAGKVHKNGSS